MRGSGGESPEFGGPGEDFGVPGAILGGPGLIAAVPAEDGPVPRAGAGAAAPTEAVPEGHRGESGKRGLGGP